MSKKIIIISSSPRKNGNSDILCDEFMRGAEAAGHAVEKIRIADSDIRYCTGCCSCVGNPGSCVQDDDMNKIYPKILDADVMVLASPIYFRSFNAHMKTFMDRVCPIYPMINGKDVYYIVAAGGGQFPVDCTIKSFRVFTDCFSNITEKATIAATGVWNENGVKGKAVLKEAFEAGKNC
jgi:multimeric flavodoxin WrbA